MSIILDGMGGDNAPEAIVQGAVNAVRSIEDQIIIQSDTFILVFHRFYYNAKTHGFSMP